MRTRADFVQLVPQLSLPEVPGRCHGAMARGAAEAPAVGAVRPRGVHAAGCAGPARTAESEAGLWSGVPSREPDAAAGRSDAAPFGSSSRFSGRSPHLGTAASPSSPYPLCRSSRRSGARWVTLGALPPGLLPPRPRAEPALPGQASRAVGGSLSGPASSSFTGSSASCTPRSHLAACSLVRVRSSGSSMRSRRSAAQKRSSSTWLATRTASRSAIIASWKPPKTTSASRGRIIGTDTVSGS